ncbi:MAG TPA: hypothetical protein VHE35_02250 [Kofleriaceae bacterium]|nr:hypothetical protein [Kofleriaceae bacterium]
MRDARKLVFGLLPAVALAGLAAWSTCRVVGAGAGVPDDAAWTRAEALVRAEHQPGDLIVFAPRWIDPVGRLHLGDLIPLSMAGRLDGDRYGTIWELDIRGARAPETRGLAAASVRDVGGVTVRRFVRAPAEVVTDLYDLPPPVTTGLVARAPARTLAEVGFEPHRCWQVVPSAGQTVTMRWDNVALGSELVLGAGLADVFTRRDVRAPADVIVDVGGRELMRTRVGVDSGWTRVTAPTQPGPATLTIRAAAIGPRSSDRLVCVALEARR